MTHGHERLGELLRLARRPVDVDASGEYREIGVRSFGRGIFHKPPVAGAEIGTKRVFEINAGDLVVSNVFAWEGAVAVATEIDEGRIGSHRFMTWVPESERVDVRYLWHYFTSDVGVALLRQASPGSAGRNKTLSIKAFENLPVPLPSRAEQLAIVESLDRLSDIERKMEEVRASQSSLVSNIGRQFLAASGRDASSVALRDVLTEVRREVAVDPEETYPMVGVRSFGRGAFAAGPLAGDSTAYQRLRQVQHDDVVYPKLMAWEGAFAVVPSKLDAHYVSPEFCTFEVREDQVNVDFLRHLFSNAEFLARFSAGATGTNVRRRRLQPADFLDTALSLPPMDVQRRLAGQLGLVRDVKRLSEGQTEIAKAMPRAARNQIFSKLA